MISAGLDCDGTCLHVAKAVSSWIVVTLLPTNVFHLFEGPCIHVNTMAESVHKYDSCMFTLSARVARLNNLDSSTAAHNSNLGNVNCLSGQPWMMHKEDYRMSVDCCQSNGCICTRRTLSHCYPKNRGVEC